MKKYGPIIYDPRSEEAERLVGKKVMFSDCYVRLCDCNDKDINIYVYPGVLNSIRLNAYLPFCQKIDEKFTPEERFQTFCFIREVIEEEKT